ncbi:oxygen-insensitive NAD(P)H nitroreductase [Acinetobacter sp. MD2(2019)]|uniref:oxygen-insensitive NAD(P)H nitroreductase n=1 Tax=Acinetobacter sp. MD2(2019) TaxID=2605273 RepID=UPI002D1E5864|nr:oxygen-insensitive NAD(P)H nitroreductase [Acinetobacter sp. MD2(2019)]MEB3752736.1 oxygen-insensitive NAD(P)H nitroreductase [Acinetobacter sp. MD2(2019)]
MDLLKIAQERYTTKAYDPNKKISQTDLNAILDVLHLAPSSINIQPWHFLVIESDAAKQRVTQAMTGPYAYNAPKVLDSSHTVVFCTRNDVTDEYLNQLVQQDAAIGRFKDAATQQAQAEVRKGYVDQYRAAEGGITRWMENQTFIALGEALFAAAALGIDSTPIGGFDAKTLDAEFNLTAQGFTSSVVLTLGYRSETDFNATLPKSRLAKEQIFTTL